MVQSAYAAAKNVERANATQRAVADALDAMATQFADQNARITTIGTATQSGIADALVIVRNADTTATAAVAAATDTLQVVNRILSMTFWQRARWFVTGRMN